MKLDGDRKSKLWAMIEERNKLLKKASILQEKIDRSRGSNSKPRAYETKDYGRRLY